ncbi:MAG: hypothetical protein KDD06_14425 [Phaeodactylibacter sp.]|nr:hypothetical protein [Phaeodactylibacter sp.]MCB9264033.1 hypothetical protein [Lewinellaceae bacterium]MCB9289891.1 hypothetical protein [Lewinellaceae bacterium]
MVISDDKTFRDIQKDFNSKFPYLKLEFYSSRHGEGEGSPIQERIDPEQLLKNARQNHTEGNIRVRKDMKVNELEQVFQEKFGLNVQVFRKSGNLWMQTTSTDHWTLAEQNRKGGASELHYKEKYRT